MKKMSIRFIGAAGENLWRGDLLVIEKTGFIRNITREDWDEHWEELSKQFNDVFKEEEEK